MTKMDNKLYDWYTLHQIKKSEVFTGETLIQYSHNTLISKRHVENKLIKPFLYNKRDQNISTMEINRYF